MNCSEIVKSSRPFHTRLSVWRYNGSRRDNVESAPVGARNVGHCYPCLLSDNLRGYGRILYRRSMGQNRRRIRHQLQTAGCKIIKSKRSENICYCLHSSSSQSPSIVLFRTAVSLMAFTTDTGRQTITVP
jgi:hypothetical protein